MRSSQKLYSQTSEQQCCEGMFPLFLQIFFLPWSLSAAAKEISSLYLTNNKILLTLITALALRNPFKACSAMLNRTTRMRDALISV